MTQRFDIHPENPQDRLMSRVVDILKQGGVIVYPTDTTYGLGCGIFNRKGVERIMRIKRLPATHQLSMLCADLSDIALYARVDNTTYRLLKRHLPGPYTFVLEASREVPKSILPRRKTIGLRIPDHPICHGLLASFGEPILSTSLRLPGDAAILCDPEDILERLSGQVDGVVASGVISERPSTVVDLTGESPVILRVGAGDPAPFE